MFREELKLLGGVKHDGNPAVSQYVYGLHHCHITKLTQKGEKVKYEK